MDTLGMTGRKLEIFLSAIDLFSTLGYENTTMKRLAAANGMKASSLYNYFPSKENLLAQIDRFYEKNALAQIPSLEETFADMERRSAKELLHRAVHYYDPELQAYMDKIYILAVMQAQYSKRAYNIVWNSTISYAKTFLGQVLQRMVDIGKIEPLDIESFLELFTSFAFTSIYRNRLPNPIGKDGWVRGLDMLFSIPKELKAT